MTDRPLVLDIGMANALRAGRKPQIRLAPDCVGAKSLPGDRILLRESWIAGRSKQGRAHGCAARDAGFAVFADGWRCHADGRGWQGRVPDMRRHEWVSAALMPRWAHRTALTVRSVHRQRLHTMTDDDCRAEGVVQILGGWRWRLPKPLPGWYRNPQDAFAVYWNTTHATSGLRWVDDPEVVVLTVTVAPADPFG